MSPQFISFINGICLGLGLLVAAIVMRTLFHVGWCG